MSQRTLKITAPHMTGPDVIGWQRTLNDQMITWGVDYRLKADGDYGITTRSLGQSVRHGLGIAPEESRDGFTPELRVRMRNKSLEPEELERFHSDELMAWRKAFKAKHEKGGVAAPLAKILTHANGWSGWHDGVDLICPRDSPGFAMCAATVVRADEGGWWGKGAPADRKIREAGDGIVIIRALVDVGPIKKGMNFCYGHAEQPRVKVGQRVDAGDWICRAGMANAPHFHFMVNGRDDDRGLGDRDPWPIIDFCIRNA